MSYVSFSTKEPEPVKVSLACQLGIGPCARWRTMASGVKLTYEDNMEEMILVHVAEKKRVAVLDDITDTQRFSIPVVAFAT